MNTKLFIIPHMKSKWMVWEIAVLFVFATLCGALAINPATQLSSKWADAKLIRVEDTKAIDAVFTNLAVNNGKDSSEFFINSPKELDISDLKISFNAVCGNVLNYELYGFDDKGEWYKPDTIKAGENRYKIIGTDFTFDTCANNRTGYLIDWQPSLLIDSSIYTQVKWAWWDNSFASRININCSQVTDGTVILINGSSGFALPGSANRQYVWTICNATNPIYLYYTDFDSYAVGLATASWPYEVDRGDGTSSANYQQVWRDYAEVYHMKFGTVSPNSTTLIDSSPSGAHAGKYCTNNAIINTSVGVAGGALQTTQNGNANNKYNCYVNTIGTTLNTSIYTVMGWTQSTGADDYQMPFTFTTPNGTGYNWIWYKHLNFGDYRSDSDAGTGIADDSASRWIFYSYAGGKGQLYHATATTPTFLNMTTPNDPAFGINASLIIGASHAYDWDWVGYVDETRLYRGNMTTTMMANILKNYAGTAGYGVLGPTVGTKFTATDFDDCSSYGIKTMQFSIFDEDSPASPLVSGVDLGMDYWPSGNTSDIRHGYVSFAGLSTYPVCMENEEDFNTNIYLQGTTSGGFTNRFYLYNLSINGTEQAFNLYNFNYTAGISLLQLIVRDYFTNNYVQNILVKLQRFYPGTGTWLTVQEFLTDNFGFALFNIIEQSVDYKLIFTDTNNSVLAATNSMAFSCTSGVCQLGYQLNQAVPATPSPSLIITPVYNPVTNSINITWTNLLSTSVTINTTILAQSYTGSQVLCSELQTGSGGVVNCNTNGYSGPVLTTMIANGQSVLSQYIELNATKIGTILPSNEGAFWAAMILISCIGMGIMISPAASLIAMMIGVVAVYLLGLMSALTLTFVILAGLLVIAVSWRLRA